MTLKGRIGLLCCLLMIFCAISPSSLRAVKKASIVMCAETGKIHHEQNADAVTPPASLTKMMTLYLTFKALREGKLTFNQKLPVSKHASLAAPCKLWLKPGSTITVHDAIMGMVTKSANDAAVAVAEFLGKGSEAQFTSLMTREARRLGMSKTIFRNSHGLPEKVQSVTTAREMAILSRRLYKDFPEFFAVFKEPEFVYKGHVHKNHNRLLGKIPGLDGIKTGFINASGFNLAASVVRDNRRIIAVVMGGESSQARNKKMVALLEETYSTLGGKNKSSSPQKIKGKLHQAVHRPQAKPKLSKTKGKYKDMTHLLHDLDQQKSFPKKRIKSSKKNPRKKSKDSIKSVSRKKKSAKKGI